jgi:hypothetical protein
MTKYIAAIVVLLTSFGIAQSTLRYKLLATSRTSTMEKEINEAAREGYRFAGTMGGHARRRDHHNHAQAARRR